MKFLCIGDIHITTDNLIEVRKLLEQILNLIEKHDPNYVVIMGDVLHTHERLHTIALNEAYKFIETIKKKKKVYILVGNHDMITGNEFLNNNHWMNILKNWENIEIADAPLVLKTNKEFYIFCPYVPPGRFKEMLNLYVKDWEKANCIFAHQEFKGCKMGPIISEIGDEWNINLPNVVSGHIHNKQKIENIYYTGSSMQHSYADTEDNILPIVNINSNNNISFIEELVDLPRKKIIYDEIVNIDNIKIKDDKNTKLCLSGTTEEFKALKKTTKYKELVKNGIKVVYKPIKINTDLNLQEKDLSDFTSILHNIVYETNDEYLIKMYKKIFI